MYGEVVGGFEAGGEEWGAEEFPQGVGDAVEEFEDEEGWDVRCGWGEEEEGVGLVRVDDGGGVGVGAMEQGGARGGG